MAGIGFLTSIVLMVFTSATLSGAVVGALTMDWRAFEAFGLLSLAYVTFSFFSFLASSAIANTLSRSGVFVGVIAMWLTLVLAALPPFMMLENANIFEAFFEATSAATTLGTSLVPVSEMSTAMIVYRSATAWLGGLLTLMLAVYVLGRYAVGGTPNGDLRTVLHGANRSDPRLLQTFWQVLIPYAGLTILCAIALVLASVDPAHAVLGALNILSTNGFVAWTTLGTVFDDQMAEFIMIIFMMLGASSIIWLRALVMFNQPGISNQKEAHTFLFAAILAIILGLALSLSTFPITQNLSMQVFNRAFDIISILTTTGVSQNAAAGVSVPLIFIIGLAMIGGSSYSTAGGIKMFRLRSMMFHSANEIRRLVYPNQILPRSVDADVKIFVAAKAIWSAFFSALIFMMLAAAIFASLGNSFEAALALSVGAFSSVGNLVSDNLLSSTAPAVSSAGLIAISSVSIIGRVELLVILAAFSRNRW